MNAQLRDALVEARRWIGDGDLSDGLSRELWTEEYAKAVDRVDAALAAPKEAGDALYSHDQIGGGQWVVSREDRPTWLYNFGHGEQAEIFARGIAKLLNSERLAAPSKEAGPAGEFLGWVHECVWKDGTSRSLHQREPKLMDATEPDGSPLAGLVSQRIVRVYANPPGDQRQEGEARFFIDHGLVHDRKTGRHLRGTGEYGDSTAEELLAVLHELEQAARMPMKLHFTRGAMREAIKADPDDAECEAASPPPEAAVTDAMVDAAIACWFRDTAHWDADEWAEQRPAFRAVLTAALAARDGGAA